MPLGAGFLLGANLPWSAEAPRPGEPKRTRAGWDFGEPPPGWSTPSSAETPRSWGETRADLALLRGLGVRDVRFFVLLHGVNYPVGGALETFGRIRRVPGGEVFERDPGIALPRLSEAFLRDFDGLLAACEATGVRLWPSLLGFETFGPLVRHDGAITSGGRASLVLGEDGGARAIERFLDVTLSPLLRVAAARPSAIGAFEVVNEPDWAVLRGKVDHRVGSVEPEAMGRFLSLAVARIAEAGLVATIGFSDADPRWLPRRDRRELLRHAARGAYVHQVHHYPSVYKARRLVPHRELPIRPCYVGELPTARGTWAPSANMRWLDRGLAETDVTRFLVERLELVRRRGYPGALVWALHSSDGATGWGDDQAAQIRAFAERLRVTP